MRLARFVWRALRRFTAHCASLRKRRKCILKPGAVLYPCSKIENNRLRQDIIVGERSQILGELLTFGHGGVIEVGRNCFIGENTRIWSADRINIGDRTLISYGVSIHDCNAHSLNADRRAEHFDLIFSTGHPRDLPDVASKAIRVGNDVWIGFGVTILKGVSIGDGAVIAACSLVTDDVAPFTVVAGNPAKFVKRAD